MNPITILIFKALIIIMRQNRHMITEWDATSPEAMELNLDSTRLIQEMLGKMNRG